MHVAAARDLGEDAAEKTLLLRLSLILLLILFLLLRGFGRRFLRGWWRLGLRGGRGWRGLEAAVVGGGAGRGRRLLRALGGLSAARLGRPPAGGGLQRALAGQGALPGGALLGDGGQRGRVEECGRAGGCRGRVGGQGLITGVEEGRRRGTGGRRRGGAEVGCRGRVLSLSGDLVTSNTRLRGRGLQLQLITAVVRLLVVLLLLLVVLLLLLVILLLLLVVILLRLLLLLWITVARVGRLVVAGVGRVAARKYFQYEVLR